VNWLTILVSSLIAFAVGGVWYSPPVFGKVFAATVGKKPTPGALGMSFAMTVAAAVLLSIIISWAGATSYRNGTLVGIVGWACFYGSQSVTNMGFEPTRQRLTVVNSVFQLLQFMILGAVIGHWQ
jgi:hypothetical protein